MLPELSIVAIDGHFVEKIVDWTTKTRQFRHRCCEFFALQESCRALTHIVEALDEHPLLGVSQQQRIAFYLLSAVAPALLDGDNVGRAPISCQQVATILQFEKAAKRIDPRKQGEQICAALANVREN